MDDHPPLLCIVTISNNANSQLTHVSESIEKYGVPMKMKVSVETLPFFLMTWWPLLPPVPVVVVCWSE